MKFAFLVWMFLLSPLAMAESKFDVKVNFASDQNTAATVGVDNLSFSDWAGEVMIAKLNIKADTKGIIKGAIQFSYTPDDSLRALALKQSLGAKEMIIKGAFEDFTDVEGRRIISITSGQILTFEIPFSVDYTDAKKNQTFEFLIELEPTEYF